MVEIDYDEEYNKALDALREIEKKRHQRLIELAKKYKTPTLQGKELKDKIMKIIDKEIPLPENLTDVYTIDFKIRKDFNKKSSKPKKEYKEEKIMKASSELKKKGDKYTVDTEMNVKEGLDGKTKRALKKSIEDEVKKKIKGFKKPVGFGVEKIVLDYSSSEDEKPKKRGRPKKGKGIIEDFDDSSSDEDDIKEYGKILKHLIGHIKDPKEKIDPNDYKQAIELIKKIKSKKA